MKKEKAITSEKAKSKVSDYSDRMFHNGFFNPICPIGYNFLTGYTTDDHMSQKGISTYNISARLNGQATFKN